MIFLRLFLTFLKIGIFNFGGGYAVISFIQDEVVTKMGWMSASEFTDIIAISQMTPGPIGINCATYAGYTAVMNTMGEGTSSLYGIAGSVIATLSLILLPVVLVLLISNLILKHRESKTMTDIFAVVRPTVVGLILAAALLLLNSENLGTLTINNVQYIFSVSGSVATSVSSSVADATSILADTTATSTLVIDTALNSTLVADSTLAIGSATVSGSAPGSALVTPFTNNLHFILSIVIFIATFIASKRFRVNPILLICIAGLFGFLLYDLILS